MTRVAILGGGIGAQHLAAYRQISGFEVVLMVDQDADRRAAVEAMGIATADTIDAAMGDGIDLVDICLPPHLHAPVAIQALGAGKHVICEKPLATSMRDVARIADAAEHAGRQVFPVFQYRFGPAFDHLHALRAAGLTGRPIAAALETHWNRDAEYYAVPWRGTWAGEQGGAVLGHAIHAHDLMCHWMGQVERVSATLRTSVNPIETDDTAALTFALAGGALATSSVTLGAATDTSRLRFVFEHLTATSQTNPYAPGDGVWQFGARDPAQQAQVDAIVRAVPTGPGGFAGFLTEVASALAGAPNRAVTLADGAASIALVTAIYASARSGQPVDLPLSADHPMHEGWRP
ncbi:Gfo/Idh/MocA family protein [Tateyamaria sp. SN6-1]|uniref:Gfo/Idh/MocA family protein n=1 Tax=Tateyamaria sp. SN6-1 TaxID=3092148 RepID=UPI0039F5DF57